MRIEYIFNDFFVSDLIEKIRSKLDERRIELYFEKIEDTLIIDTRKIYSYNNIHDQYTSWFVIRKLQSSYIKFEIYSHYNGKLITNFTLDIEKYTKDEFLKKIGFLIITSN